MPERDDDLLLNDMIEAADSIFEYVGEISFDEFNALNPEYNRPVATAKGNVHEILLPVSAAQTFTDNLSNYDKPLVSWQAYHAKRGERMDHIASKFGINVAQLREANGMSAGKKVASTSTMLVPSNSSSNSVNNDVANAISQDDAQGNGQSSTNIDTDSLENNNLSTTSDHGDSTKKTVMHKVKKGESIAQVAKKYGVNAKQLMAKNSLKSGKLKAGQLIKVSFTDNKSSDSKLSHSKSSSSKSSSSKQTSSKNKKNVSKSNNHSKSTDKRVISKHRKAHA